MTTHQNAALMEALKEAKGCFEAAKVEGLSDVLALQHGDEIWRLKDLVERRLMFAEDAIDRAIALASPAPRAEEADTQEVVDVALPDRYAVAHYSSVDPSTLPPVLRLHEQADAIGLPPLEELMRDCDYHMTSGERPSQSFYRQVRMTLAARADLQNELSERARLLSLSAERELRLLAIKAELEKRNEEMQKRIAYLTDLLAQPE